MSPHGMRTLALPEQVTDRLEPVLRVQLVDVVVWGTKMTPVTAIHFWTWGCFRSHFWAALTSTTTWVMGMPNSLP